MSQLHGFHIFNQTDRVSQNARLYFFMNNSVENRPIFVIFGIQHSEEI